MQICVQWNPSKADITGEVAFITYKETSLICNSYFAKSVSIVLNSRTLVIVLLEYVNLYLRI